jgi:hypothetical protein
VHVPGDDGGGTPRGATARDGSIAGGSSIASGSNTESGCNIERRIATSLREGHGLDADGRCVLLDDLLLTEHRYRPRAGIDQVVPGVYLRGTLWLLHRRGDWRSGVIGDER